MAVLLLLMFGANTRAGDVNFASGFEDPFRIIMAEPPVVLQSAGVAATVHMSGLLATPFSVRLVGPGAVEEFPAFTFDPAHPGLLEVEVPTALATGNWDLVVERADQGATASLVDAFQVVDVLSVVFDLQPAALPSAPGGEIRLDSDGDFTAVPQVLLRPDGAPPSAPATLLRSVSFKSTDRVYAQIPPGLGAGTYDVIAINPDGTAGLVDQGLVISSEAAPSISEVFPLVLPVSSPGQFTVDGTGYQPGIAGGLVCEDDSAQPFNVNFNGSTSLTLDYTPGVLSTGVCVLDLINPDGQEAVFASVRLAPSSGGVGQPVAAAGMMIARRSPALAMHRVDSESFNLYAMGGDDGAVANAFDSVEFGMVDEFGAIDGWTLARNSLPEGRTFAWGGQYGDFLYLVGGSDGSTAVDTVLRAQILDAGSAPIAVRHTLLLSTGAPGFSGGQQAYRISPVFPAGDAVNPGGEGLAGRARNVFVPAMAEVGLRLEWDAVPGAEAYNVYTNPQGVPYDGDPDALELVATTASTSWIHNGQVTNPMVLPLPPGETGAWHEVPSWSLATARSDFAGAIAPLKGTPGSIVLYAIGGLDDMGTTLGGYEYSVISSAGTATPGYGAFTNGTDSLTTPVRNLVAWTVTTEGTDDSWIFAGTGFDAVSAAQRDVERGTVSMTGDLGTFVAGGFSPSSDRAGASGLVGASTLALAGGLNGAASTSMQESPLSDSGSGPEMDHWNALGFGLAQARVFAGTAHGAVFIFVAGGADAMGDPLTSVERLTR